MTLKVDIPEELRAGLQAQARARGLSLEEYVAEVLRERGSRGGRNGRAGSAADAARRLGSFGKRHGLSLGDMTVKDLLTESRP
jgi:hypothetical protein